jgi:hypothetical protein
MKEIAQSKEDIKKSSKKLLPTSKTKFGNQSAPQQSKPPRQSVTTTQEQSNSSLISTPTSTTSWK